MIKVRNWPPFEPMKISLDNERPIETFKEIMFYDYSMFIDGSELKDAGKVSDYQNSLIELGYIDSSILVKVSGELFEQIFGDVNIPMRKHISKNVTPETEFIFKKSVTYYLKVTKHKTRRFRIRVANHPLSLQKIPVRHLYKNDDDAYMYFYSKYTHGSEKAYLINVEFDYTTKMANLNHIMFAIRIYKEHS